MPFQSQETPQSSHMSSMASRRLPPISIPQPGGSFSHTTTDYRVPPSPLNLPPISQLNPPPANHHPSTNFANRYLPAPQFGSNVQAPHPFHARPLASYGVAAPAAPAAGSSSTPSNPPLSAPATTFTFGSHNYNHNHNHSQAATAPNPGGDRGWGKAEVEKMRHLLELEVFTRNDLGEVKGKAYLRLWLGIQEVGLQDIPSKRLFIAKHLMPCPWFKGDETVGEALCALQRLDFIHCGLIAKKHNENANFLWDMKLGDLTVREYWVEEGRKQRRQNAAQTQALVQAQAQSQAQTQAPAQAQR